MPVRRRRQSGPPRPCPQRRNHRRRKPYFLQRSIARSGRTFYCIRSSKKPSMPVKAWLGSPSDPDSIAGNTEKLAAVLTKYGLNPTTEQERLKKPIRRQSESARIRKSRHALPPEGERWFDDEEKGVYDPDENAGPHEDEEF